MSAPIRVGFHVEGGIDLLTLRILLERLLAREVSALVNARRPGGIDAVLSKVEGACWHFWREGAIAAVFAIDNDESLPVHDPSHEGTTPVPGCRFCLLRSKLVALPDRFASPNLRTAVCVPVQAIEAWLLVATGESRPEAVPLRDLKRRVFGKDHPPRAVWEPEIDAICRDIDLGHLRRTCASFTDFERQVSAWTLPGVGGI